MANNKAANAASNKIKTAMSYVYNTPIFFIVTFLLCVFIYQMIHAHRDRNDIIKHKVETEIKKKLYY